VTKGKTIARKGVRLFAYLLFLLISVFLLLEVCYRFYLVDFYGSNLQGLNPPTILAAPKEQATILAMGDSFTADLQSYIRDLRDSLPQYRVINSAVPGTCVKQSHLMIQHRIQTFQPDILIYQIYVGNDLLEYRHRTKGAPVSNVRKGYWWLSDRLWSLAYINSRLPYIRQAIAKDLPQHYDPKDLQDYSPEKYSKRSRLHFLAEPQLLENTVLLKGGREKDFINYLKELNEMLEVVPETCQVLLLLIPHCAQLNETYQSRMQAIGARFEEGPAIFAEDFPFYTALTKGVKRPNVQYLNALPILKAGEQKEPMYYGNDPHLNFAGQRTIGAYLVDALKK